MRRIPGIMPRQYGATANKYYYKSMNEYFRNILFILSILGFISAIIVFAIIDTRTPEQNTPTPVISCVPKLITPNASSVMDNGCANQQDIQEWSFDWEECQGADQYELLVQKETAQYPAISTVTIESQFSEKKIAYVVDRNREGWQWRVRARINGAWSDWSPYQQFQIEPLDTDCTL